MNIIIKSLFHHKRPSVGGAIKKKHDYWSVFPGGLEKPKPARTIDTLADGS